MLVSEEVRERQPLSPTRRKLFHGGSMAASLSPTVGSKGYLAFTHIMTMAPKGAIE